LSLPGVLAALALDRMRGFPALRAHQRHAWHAFLAQLGAVALHTAGRDAPPEETEGWADLLRGLTPDHDDDAPWRLVVADAAEPAFLQPPSPAHAPPFAKRIETPDALDVLVTARNFEVKQAVAARAEAEDWAFALVSLQTMEGFLGAGNYGVARMNGGFSARPFLGMAPADGGFGAHVRRDWAAMLARRAWLAEAYGYPAEGGRALLWLEPWDGRTSLPLSALDPFFIEVCRRVRLFDEGGRLIARGAGTAAARVAAKEAQGVTGDFWAPVNRAEGKAFSLTEAGFSTAVICRLLFGDGGTRSYDDPPALTLTPAERRASADWVLVARGVARGQGKTEGWHERVAPFSHRMACGLGEPETRAALGALAQAQLQELRHVVKSLRLGCAVMASSGSDDDPDRDDYGAGAPYEKRLEAVGEASFFPALRDRFEERAGARDAFLRTLVRTATTLLEEAAAVIPCSALRRPKARFRARRAFFGALWSARGPLANDRDLIGGDRDAA
jgi:CRISPR system Cascade subunit CasA